jgi:hypothetical protein
LFNSYLPDRSDFLSTTYKVLKTDTDFLIAAMLQVKVSVWFRLDDYPEGRINDYGEIVEGYHLGMTKIAGSWFRRDRFEFRAYIK